MTKPPSVRCKGCGQQVIWVHSPRGKLMPLDASSVCYEMTGTDVNGTPCVRIREGAWVSHFRTCSKAAQFSKGSASTEKELDAHASPEPVRD